MRLAVLVTLFSLCFTGAAQAASCSDPALSETNITEKLSEFPTYLVRMLDGQDLQRFMNNLSSAGLLLGVMDIDRIYLIISDKHPSQYIIYFIKEGCIVKDGYTPKTIIDGMLP